MAVAVAIFDYGAGNIFSLKNAIEREKARVDIITGLEELDERRHSGLFLPGVGNFDPAMRSIAGTLALKERFKRFIRDTNMPVLGICLGMEMFFDTSDEGHETGLKVINGRVCKLPHIMNVPHMGWNNLEITRPGRLLKKVPNGSWVYFAHSYFVHTELRDIITAESDYEPRIPAVIEQDSFIGTQFHPEKSGLTGRIIIKNFLDVCKR